MYTPRGGVIMTRQEALQKCSHQNVHLINCIFDDFEDVDRLATIIREVDGNHSLGAGALAEAIIQKLESS